jgi:hypothetical protein
MHLSSNTIILLLMICGTLAILCLSRAIRGLQINREKEKAMTNILTKRTNARITFPILVVCCGLLPIAAATTSQAGGLFGFNIDVDLDKMIGRGGGIIGDFVGPPTGRVAENDGSWCVMNDWQARDGKASAAGRFDHRFSRATQVGGRWYCYEK